ncbi:ATP-binding cassette domain-containing protein [Nocardia alba]|uniref:Peptide/nickel transport system ATP-binding protein/peptide/nickel transport system permease protein n=1 Tax=Nocardia alba TaxID=225051 RepID=A0A4V6NCQ4_9NOCA|nr:ATP-binding cassette domain-containing protein [Nocardia alba]TCJ97185.1 peptide/nickel transport system ATP-binding protein/peptide/nickel transport system permease protein [Nocardia alba]
MKARLRSGWSVVIALVLLLVVTGPLFAPHAPTAVVARPFQPPSDRYLLGTDVVGRDVLSRVLHGGLSLVTLAGLALVIAYGLGLTLGLLSGLRRGHDRWIRPSVDAVVVLPWFLLLAVIATVLGTGPTSIVVTATVTTVPWIVRIVRTGVLELADTGYVESARARGESLWWIAVVEVLPNLRAVVLADLGVRISASVSLVAVSGFLGLGMRPPSPDWALMITENRAGFVMQPWAVLAPTLLVMVLVISVNMVTDRAFDQVRGSRGAVPATTDADGVAVSGLTVRDSTGHAVLEDVSLRIAPGRAVALVGPSGAGKSTLALALLGALPTELSTEGTVGIGGRAGSRRIGYVPQDPSTALNPALRIGTALHEIARANANPDRRAAVLRALEQVDLPADREFRRRYPHQISGGQQQRVLLAMAMLGDPLLLVLDEPTTGLDQRTRAHLVATLEKIRGDTALLVITHDLPTVASLVDEVVELDQGRVVSVTAATAGPSVTAVATAVSGSRTTGSPILRVENLTVGHHRSRPVVRDLSFALRPGECLAIEGRSGTGKTTVARTLAGLHTPASGFIEFEGIRMNGGPDRHAHRGAIQLIFQNPATSLNPAHRMGVQVARPLRLLHGQNRSTAGEQARELLDGVGLDERLARHHPSRLSGGQQQRAAIARALAARPRVLVCDEITSALDPATQSVVLDLLDELRHDGMALIVISHQREVIDRLADSVVTLTEADDWV